MNKLKENILFIREAITKFHDTGTLFPTSRWAAKALIHPIRERTTPKRILELGPGNGSVTIHILNEMIDGDHLTICEINPTFVRALKHRLRRLDSYKRRKHQITFFVGPAQELPEDQRYDLIFCALPFLNFELDTVKEIFEKIKRLSSTSSLMTYYEYVGIRSVSKVISPRDRRNRIKDLDVFFKRLRRDHTIDQIYVWRNFLPIHVYALSFARRTPSTKPKPKSTRSGARKIMRELMGA